MKRWQPFWLLLPLLALSMLLLDAQVGLAADQVPPPTPSEEAADGALAALPDADNLTFLAAIFNPRPLEVEVRALWVTRFDWTSFGQPASRAKIDEIVANAAYAGFNTIYFQVRGTADAYYTPGLEPWAQRVSGGSLGDPPPDATFDPLAYFVEQAHAAHIQLHAYLNIYPVWDCGSVPPATTPTHLYYQLQNEHGSSFGRNHGLQWSTSYVVHCAGYQRGTPASIFLDDHLMAVANDLVDRYAIDGIHLDHIRYGGSNVSCDPVSEARYGLNCFGDGNYGEWQRAQVNGTVNRFYNDVVLPNQGIWLSAAVWPIYQDYWSWGGAEGYFNYFQDSTRGIAEGYIDSISPMIYPSTFSCPYNGFWTLAKWETLVADFQVGANGRYIIPGIGAGYCTFDEILNRINAARAIGTAGHAIFSYSGLLSGAYFDDLRNGPYANPAVVPPITWHQ